MEELLWNLNISVGTLPEKIATAFYNVFEDKLAGAEYAPIAYLGNRVSMGTDHALLAEQAQSFANKAKNIVLIILKESPGDTDGTHFNLCSIIPIVDGTSAVSGRVVDVKSEIPEEAQNAFNKEINGSLSEHIKPFLLLATQVLTEGIAYIFATEIDISISSDEAGHTLIADTEPDIAIVTVSPKSIDIETMLSRW